MCYDVSSGLRSSIKYAKHRQDDPEKIAELEKQLEVWRKEEHQHFHLNGFAHPKLLVFTNEEPQVPSFFTWGLIPSWCKDEASASLLANQTLNARAESIFEKPAFRESARSKRCLVYIDGFYEYHHFKGKSFPFYFSMKNDMPIILAGLWDSWTNKQSGEIVHTVSIITTRANALMARIHNNPKQLEPRMPAILSRDKQDQWLQPVQSALDLDKLKQLLLPFPQEALQCWTVSKLKGKNASGDNPSAIVEVIYPELNREKMDFTGENLF